MARAGATKMYINQKWNTADESCGNHGYSSYPSIKGTGTQSDKKKETTHFFNGWHSGTYSNMILDNSSDVKYSARCKSANKIHKRNGLLGKRLASVSIQIEQIVNIQRIIYRFS